MPADAPLVGSVMTPFPHAVSLDQSLAVARRLMAEHQVRHLPVKERGQLVGLVSDRDIKLVLGPSAGVAIDGQGPLVRHACILDVYTAEMDTPLGEVVATLARRRIGSALITRQGRLAGIFTATDACRYLADLLGFDVDPPPPTDDQAA